MQLHVAHKIMESALGSSGINGNTSKSSNISNGFKLFVYSFIIIILLVALFVGGIFTTITTAQIPQDNDKLRTSYYVLIGSSVSAWIGSALIVLIIVFIVIGVGAAVYYGGSQSVNLLLQASPLVLIMVVAIALLCTAVAILNVYALANAAGYIPYEVGWFAAVGGMITGMAAVVGFGFLILLLALKQPPPPSIETIVIV